MSSPATPATLEAPATPATPATPEAPAPEAAQSASLAPAAEAKPSLAPATMMPFSNPHDPSLLGLRSRPHSFPPALLAILARRPDGRIVLFPSFAIASNDQGVTPEWRGTAGHSITENVARDRLGVSGKLYFVKRVDWYHFLWH
jgi:hypothetical protein